MTTKKSPRTPRASMTTKVPASRSSTRRSGRKVEPEPGSESDSERASSPATPRRSANLKGSVSPYFDKTATGKNGSGRRSAAGASNGRAGGAVNGRPSRVKAAPVPKGKSRARGRKKDPQDVTGMTETEESSEESDLDDATEDEFAPSDGADEGFEEEDDEEEEEEEEAEVDSDDLDETPKRGAKRKAGKGGGAAKKSKAATGKAGTRQQVEGYEDEDDLSDVELEDGQEIAGRIYPAPKTGQVPPGQISLNTLNFLKNLQIPERNDREWFRSHEPAYRQAEKEWKMFVGLIQLKMQEADDQLPLLPPKDVIHRIYRDIRFSSDKTPYKRSFSLSTSRSGRKGVYAGYHLSISPNDRSIMASGVWCPGKDELGAIRHHVLAAPERLREVIGAKDFVKLFGPAKAGKNGERQNVFGHEDALKVAPKGVDKGHPDIDLLKLRSVAVVHKFSDEEVLGTDFPDEVRRVMSVMAPLVHLLNDFIAHPAT